MFCPKCGQQNPEAGKFCRGCGTDLGDVSDALAGKAVNRSASFGLMEPMQPMPFGPSKDDKIRRSDPTEVYADGIKGMLSGLGFLIVSMVLLFTNVANGSRWWWAMLFPAFIGLSKGISDYLKSRKMERSVGTFSTQNTSFSDSPANSALPPQTQWPAAAESRYQTGDLVPPSVTDGTTRHLEMDSEGKTMTLPKQ